MADAEDDVRNEMASRGCGRVIQYSALGSISELFKGQAVATPDAIMPPALPTQTRTGRRSMRRVA
jgi:hypothetical protein